MINNSNETYTPSIYNAGPVPPLPQHFYHATQHNVGDWPSVPAVHLNQENHNDASEPYHRMWPPKLHREIYKTMNLLTSASFI